MVNVAPMIRCTHVAPMSTHAERGTHTETGTIDEWKWQ